jgi:hypothetical protein
VVFVMLGPLAKGAELTKVKMLMEAENARRVSFGQKPFPSEKEFLDFMVARQLDTVWRRYRRRQLQKIPQAQLDALLTNNQPPKLAVRDDEDGGVPATLEGTITSKGKLVAHVIEAEKNHVEIHGTRGSRRSSTGCVCTGGLRLSLSVRCSGGLRRPITRSASSPNPKVAARRRLPRGANTDAKEGYALSRVLVFPRSAPRDIRLI